MRLNLYEQRFRAIPFDCQRIVDRRQISFERDVNNRAANGDNLAFQRPAHRSPG